MHTNSLRGPVVIGLFAVFFAGCMKTLSVPMNNPATGAAPHQELRRAHDDKWLKKDCVSQGYTDCMDNFWRLESVESQRVVFRYRKVSWDEKGTHVNPKWVQKITLVTEDGRTFSPRLSERFSVYRLPTVSYHDNGWVKTGRRVHRRQGDGSIVSEDETRQTIVTKKLPRYAGLNFVVFEGTDIITADSRQVVFRFPKGLFGIGGAEWTFRFDSSEPVNAEVAIPEQSRTSSKENR